MNNPAFQRFHWVKVRRVSQRQGDRQQMPEQMQGGIRRRTVRPWGPAIEHSRAPAGILQTGGLMRKLARPVPRSIARDEGRDRRVVRVTD